MTAREYAAILDSVIQIARERGILRKDATATDLIPQDRLEFLSSATATIYIQEKRDSRSPVLPPTGKSSGPSHSAAGDDSLSRGKGGDAGRIESAGRSSPTPEPAAAPAKSSERQPMASKYPGKCWRCLIGYPPGEPILSEKVDGMTKWGHAACVRSPR